MRRRSTARLTVSLTTLALLSGCHYASSPVVGAGDFLYDTHRLNRHPSTPPGDSEVMRQVVGRGDTVAPLLPESGNVWPGPAKIDPSIGDLEKQQNEVPATTQPAPDHRQPRPSDSPATSGNRPRGSSTPPPPPPPEPLPPRNPADITPVPAIPGQPPPTIGTSNGPAVLNPGNGGPQTYSVPGGGTGMVVPNGNGTSTLIGPDGSVQTVPTAR